MAFYSCNRYRLIVLLLLILILWQIFRLLPNNHKEKLLYEPDIVKLEDGAYNIHKQDKVKVRVYYEALCIDSKHFFIRHLGPVTEKLSDFLDVTLVPYGKATTTEENGKYSFKCQHGQEECFANKIHACAIETLINMTTVVKFTECMIADNMDPNQALQRCADQMKIDSTPISDCADHNKGSALLKKHGDDTKSLKPGFIPTVVVNGSKDNQGALLKNFLLEICKLIDMPLPAPCL